MYMILSDRVLLFIFLPKSLYDVHVYVGNSVISGGCAEGAGSWAEALHEGGVSLALSVFGPARTHDVLVCAFVILHSAAVAGHRAVHVHKVGVGDALPLPGPPPAVG